MKWGLGMALGIGLALGLRFRFKFSGFLVKQYLFWTTSSMQYYIIHFISNSLFSRKQFGFIKGRSTVLQLLHVLDTWVKNLEEGGQTDVICTDFAKAFDKVPHCRLISKLRSYGVSDQLIIWIKDFLLHRVRDWKLTMSFQLVTL